MQTRVTLRPSSPFMRPVKQFVRSGIDENWTSHHIDCARPAALGGYPSKAMRYESGWVSTRGDMPRAQS
eukprot:1266389-Pyramimonas_sp.AAC.1